MPAHFDTDAEDDKLRAIHEQEAEDLARILSEKYGIPYTDLTIMPINADALRLVPQEEAEAARAIAYDKNGAHLSLAVNDPQRPALADLVRKLTEAGYVVEQYLVSEKSINAGMQRYKDLSLATESKTGVFDVSGSDLTDLSGRLTSLPLLRVFLTDAMTAHRTASAVFEGILAAAFAMKASDIHLEPEESAVRMRFRLDGVLTDVFSFDLHGYKLLNSRIKLLSGLKLNVENRAQDGRFTVEQDGAQVEIRTSVIPGNYGESIVLRVLDPSAISHSFVDMGIHPKLLERLALEIRRPNGMLLTTGPTGSGKTTTLYAFLKEIHTPDIKVVTIEDPIEYHLEGIVQTQTNGKDYTFASGLRSILRQDPDVIMVGEIRDKEVAETAIQAALTGHFVFSTLHTNDAAGAFPRLIDLGIDPKTIPSAVTVAMAQRLVRTLDPEARAQRPTTPEEREKIERIFSTLTDPSLMPPSIDTVWAPAPRNAEETGYKGRIGVHEAIFMDEGVAKMLRYSPSSADIFTETRRQGYLSMAQDGVLKAIAGITSLEEVFKVVDVPHA